MSFKGDRKTRILYLLALLQLVGGPLILLQVTFFCKLTLREAPEIGIAAAASQAWNSDEFQAVLIGDIPKRNQNQFPHPSQDPGSKVEKVKSPFIHWQTEAPFVDTACVRWKMISVERVWTPAWPQAPPGPPPRLG